MITYGVLLESALGFGVEPERFIQDLLAAPGLQPRSIRCQDRKVTVAKARELLAESLRSFSESWAADVENSVLGSWAWAMATHLVASRVNNFDSVGIGAAAESIDVLLPWFIGLCEAGRAECAILDDKSVVNEFRNRSKAGGLHQGLPGIGWMTWLGPQILTAAPAMVDNAAWSRVARSKHGALCLTGDAPPDQATRTAIMTSLGAEWFHPNATGLKFDLSGKNTVTPAWLTSDKPPGGMIVKRPKK
jgi:hypothetical protein